MTRPYLNSLHAPTKIMHHRKPRNMTSTIGISNKNSPVTKKFTRRDLENACRKSLPSRKESLKAQRGQIELASRKAAGAESQLKSLDAGVKMCARKYNDFKAKADRLESQLQQKRDSLIELNRECNVLDDMVEGNNEEAKQIESLKKEIQEANTVAEDKKHYRFKLNHMYMRQRKNAITVDAHMSELATTLASAKTEKRRCQKLLAELDSSVTSSLHDYENIEKEIQLERSNREVELATKQIEVENAEKMEEWRNDQETNRKDFQQTLVGSNQADKENKLKRIKELESELKSMSKVADLRLSGKDSSEEAFMHIKRETGVNSVEEMVEKIISRQDQSNSLLNEKSEAEERLSLAKKKLDASCEAFNHLKSSGTGETELNRNLVDSVNNNIEKERADGKILKSINGRLDTILVGLRQGGMGLYQRLLPFHQTFLDGDHAPLMNDTINKNSMDVANDTLKMLQTVQEIVVKMLDAIGGTENIVGNTRSSQLKEQTPSMSKLENPNLGEHNCRIRARGQTPFSIFADTDDDDGAADCGDSDKGRVGVVATRRTIKAQCMKELGDVQKSIELERKRQNLKEKLPNEEGQQPNDIAKKIQRESIVRMSQHHLPIGLPKSVSLRDDPLTRADAFLTEVPIIE